MKITEARTFTEQEITNQTRDLRQEYFNLRLQQAGGQIEKTSRLKEIRRAVARLATAKTEKSKGLQIKSRIPAKKGS